MANMGVLSCGNPDTSIEKSQSSWTAQICNRRMAASSNCSHDMECGGPNVVDLIENFGSALNIADLAPIVMAHQFEQQRDGRAPLGDTFSSMRLLSEIS